MARTVEMGWLNRAICLCRGSAAAYKAAFMLTSDPGDERHLLELCTLRYALLERLLGELAVGVGPAHLRRLLECDDSDDVQPANLEVALATAFNCDCGLAQMFGSDLATLADSSIVPILSDMRTPLRLPVVDARSLQGAVWQLGEAGPRRRATLP